MFFDKRNITNVVNVGNIPIGGTNFISVQSMTNTDTRNAGDTLRQIKKIMELGGDIVRVAVPDMKAADALQEIVANSPLPVVADIHFDYRLALKAIETGVAKLRLNPGNIGNNENVMSVARAAKDKNIPIRIGVNAGSLENDLAKSV
ncbi:flavodoxin-dependent (E)-4-hydroxy-3-methylbut-2-enyl-diphosphate synthase, partial [bacterium]|nr:flavodoxin-dependent (E)-4-hydroxy-3-methylbut-2-enyl-diphosphate synthase [bacterium]